MPSRPITAVALALLASAPRLASATPSVATEDVGSDERSSTSRMSREQWGADVGARTGFVRDDGYAPFATNRTLTQLSLALSRAIPAGDHLSFAPGVRWDVGGRSATARGADTSLVAHRVSIALEGRYYFASWIYAFVRAAPGALWTKATLKDSGATADLVSSGWGFSADVSAGGAYLLGPSRAASSRALQVWLIPEAGYGWTGSRAMQLQPESGDDDLRRYGGLELRPLSLRGAFLRVGVAVTY